MSLDLIRPMMSSDLEIVLYWRNHLDVRKYMFNSHKISRLEHEAWYAKMSARDDKHLLIFEQDGAPSGFVAFDSSLSFGVAEWTFHVAPDKPSGIGGRLGLSALSYGFSNLGLSRIYGQVLDFNERSIRFHIKLGFRQEGLLRNHHFDGIHYHSIYCFGLLRGEWSAHVASSGLEVKGCQN